MNIETIKPENLTEEEILKDFSARKRFRPKTNLNKHENILLNKGKKIVHDDYINYFKRLEKAGVGSIIHRKGLKFIWNYNLKGFAKAALGQGSVNDIVSLVNPRPTIKRGPGRPPGSLNKNKTVSSSLSGEKTVNITLKINVSELQSILHLIK